jgi:hypothetical protein
MLAELEADLSAAISDGKSLREYVGDDVSVFAVEWARARGLIRVRLTLISTAAVGIVGCVPGAIFALFVAYGMSSEAFAELVGMPRSIEEPITWEIWYPSGWLLLVLYTLAAVFAYLGTIAAVSAWLSWRNDPAKGQTLRYLSLGMPFGTAAAIFSAIGFASTRDFSTDISVVSADVVVAAAVFAACIAVLRFAAARRERLRLALAEI